MTSATPPGGGTIPSMANALPISMPDGYEAKPLDLESLPPELRAKIKADIEDIASGRVKAIPHSEVQKMIEEMRRAQTGE